MPGDVPFLVAGEQSTSDHRRLVAGIGAHHQARRALRRPDRGGPPPVRQTGRPGPGHHRTVHHCGEPPAVPVVVAQHVHRCEPTEKISVLPGEPDHGVPVGAAEGEDRPVRVGRHHQSGTRRGGDQVTQQCRMGRHRVLQVIDQDPVPAGPQCRAGRRVGQQDAHPVHEFVVVEHPLGVEDVEVLLDEMGGTHPHRPTLGAAEPGDVGGIETELAGPRHQVAQLPRERPGADRLADVLGPGLGGALQDLSQAQFLLRGGQHPPRILAGGLGPQGVAQAVDAEHRHAGPGRPEPLGHPLGEGPGGTAGESEQEDPFGGDTVVTHMRDGGLDQSGGLAGAGGPEYEQGPLPVVGHHPLGRVEDRAGIQPVDTLRADARCGPHGPRRCGPVPPCPCSHLRRCHRGHVLSCHRVHVHHPTRRH
ncbi:hypothetical protein SDC9_63065 [bioreactor metagenome]|uniref:Uncharacterized protein n=1 Tax=bioreactor metagenome TaxID=1076179 RepID=A0A644XRD8_9ZZZZ